MRTKESKKHAIISVARDLFSRFGLEKTTVEDIAKAVRVKKGALYYYFENKEAIFAAVMHEEMKELKKAILRALSRAHGARGKLKAYIVARMTYLGRKANEYVTIRDEYLRHYEFIETLRSDYSGWEVTTISTILTEGVESGEMRIKKINLVAESIFHALKGLEYTWATNERPAAVRKNVEVLVEILFNGLAAR